MKKRSKKEWIELFGSTVKDRSVPNMIFVVPPGDGPPAAENFGRAFYGDRFGSNFSTIYAKFEPVRNAIEKVVARVSADFPFCMIAIVDVDSLPDPQQKSICSIMEEHVKTCRFILTCKDAGRVIDDIKKHCVVVDIA